MHATPPEEHSADAELAPPSASGDFSGRVAAAVRWQALDQAVQQGLRFAVMVVLAKLVAPSAFGVVALAIVVTELAVLLSQMGVSSALVQRRDLTRTHVAVGFTITTLFGIAVALVVAGLARPLAAFFDEPRLDEVLYAMTLAFVFKGMHAVPLDLLRRDLHFARIMAMSTSATVLAGVTAVVLAFADAGVWALVAFTVGEAFGALVVVWFLAIRSGSFRPRFSLERTALRELFGFGAFVSANQLLWFAQGNVDNLIVGRVLGSTALGYYSIAFRLMLLPIQRIADVVGVVAFPAFSSLQHDLPRLRSAFFRAVRSITLVCFPLSIGTVVAAPLIVELVFGTRWLPAVPVVQILALNGPRLALTRLGGSALLARDRAREFLHVSVITFVLAIVGYLIGVEWGVAGVAWGYTISGHIALPLVLRRVGQALETSAWSLVGTAVPAAVGAATLAVIGWVATQLVDGSWPLAVRLVPVVAASALVYAATVQVGWPGVLSQLVRDLLRRAGRRPAPQS